jgi:tetratricopeptide (TPR) repeat protein
LVLFFKKERLEGNAGGMVNRKQSLPPAAQRAFTTAVGHHQAGRLAEAVTFYRRALALHPPYVEAQQNLGSALSDQGQLDAAVACFHRALGLRPDYPMAHLNLGNAYWAQGRAEEAIAAYDKAIALRPDFAEAHTFRAIVLGEEGLTEPAIAACRRALMFRPGFPDAHNTLGNLLRMTGRVAEAVGCYRRALALAPDYPDAHFDLGMALLALGEFEAGWPEYEWRWKTPQMMAAARRLPQPQWRGEPAAGRRLLIHAEQGFGDTLQFCRFAPLAAARGMAVLLEVPRPLARLCGSLPGVEAVVPLGETLPEFDLHCPMASLPLVLGTTLATIPASVPYLAAEAAAVAAWRERLPAEGLRVGLVWAGNPSPDRPSRAAMDRRRSLAPDRLQGLLAVPGAHFVSLQKGGPTLPAHAPVTDLMAEVADFADTAALVANLDLVIAVDTAVAHLAGALGRPVWLLDRFDPDWRWMTGRPDSPWYPSLRIYRQPAPGDWESVLAEVARDLNVRVAAG